MLLAINIGALKFDKLSIEIESFLKLLNFGWGLKE